MSASPREVVTIWGFRGTDVGCAQAEVFPNTYRLIPPDFTGPYDPARFSWNAPFRYRGVVKKDEVFLSREEAEAAARARLVADIEWTERSLGLKRETLARFDASIAKTGSPS